MVGESPADRRRRRECWALTPAERLARFLALQAAVRARMSPAGQRHFHVRNHHQRRLARPLCHE